MKGDKSHQKHRYFCSSVSVKHFNSVQSYKQRPYWKKKICQNNQNSYHWVWILSCMSSNLSFCLSSTVCSIKQQLCLSLLCRWAHHVISINNKMRSANKWTHSEGGRVMGPILWWGLHCIYPHTKSSQKQIHRKIILSTEPEKILPFIIFYWVQWLPDISTSRMSCPNSSVSLICTLPGDWALPLLSYQAQTQWFSGSHSMLRCFTLVYRMCFLSSSSRFWSLQKPPPLAAVTQSKMHLLRAASLKHNIIFMY